MFSPLKIEEKIQGKVNHEKINSLVKKVAKIGDPKFLETAFSFVASERKERDKLIPDNLHRTIVDEQDDLSRRLDYSLLMESASVRNVLKTRRLANLLIDEKGALKPDIIKKAISLLKDHLYFLGPSRQDEGIRNKHILLALELLDSDKELKFSLQKIFKPYQHKQAEEIIRQTLNLTDKTVITDAHARKAALAAWFCYLRQAVGSCFATAPAIILHDEQPHQFMKDISELFGTGSLKRTFEGVEYSVPLCTSSGRGGLNELFLFPDDFEEGIKRLSENPGLIASLEAADVLPKEDALKDRIRELKRLLLQVFENFKNDHGVKFFSAEGILKRILLQKYEITEEDLKEFKKRPRGMIHGSLLLQVPQASKGSGGKGEACTSYEAALKRAEIAYKMLHNNTLLRCWEYTLASFAETKSEFAKWNLYSSLGLKPDEDGGIGEALFQYLKLRLDEANRKVEEYQLEYEQIFTQVKTLESRIRHAGEEEAKWIKVEYQTRVNELRTIEELRDKAHGNARRFAGMYDLLIDHYLDLFPKYFQEVYDPEMVEMTQGPYDDSPAGFRLLYKHGRSNSAQWTPIRDPQEFIQNLAAFFTAAERELHNDPDFKGAQEVLSEITTAIVTHIRTDKFLETAFNRMARAHGTPIIENPLEHLERVEKKPWVYTSGGNLHTLVSVYFLRSSNPSSLNRWVENPMELLVFIADTLKKVPYKQMEAFVKNDRKSMLMHSPTHAFLLKPGFCGLKKAWENGDFTFTWVRDHLILPMEQFVANLMLNEDMMGYLVKKLSIEVPSNYKHYFLKLFGHMKGSMRCRDFRSHLVTTIDHELGLKNKGIPVLSSSKIDSLLFQEIPLFPIYQLRDRVQKIISRLDLENDSFKKEILSLLDKLVEEVPRENVLGAKTLYETILGLYCLVKGETSLPFDLVEKIKLLMESEGFAMPRPIIFADTNWIKNDFGFVLNPGNGKLELWRMDRYAIEGEPMASWKMWLDGSRKHPDWGIFYNAYEYQI